MRRSALAISLFTLLAPACARADDWVGAPITHGPDLATVAAGPQAPAPRVVTFDCYGTLVDWDGGLATFLYDLCLRHGQTQPEPGHVLRERWEEIQFGYVQGKYMRYREVLARSLRDWMDEGSLAWDDTEGEALLAPCAAGSRSPTPARR